MKSVAVCFFVVLIFVIGNEYVLGQVQTERTGKRLILDDVQNRPELGVEFAKISKLKIFLSKKKYYLEEMMTLDLGLLVDDSNNYFFPKDLNYRIIIKDKQGKRIPIDIVYSVDADPKFEVQKNTIIRGSFSMLIGCENKIMQEIRDSTKFIIEDNIETLFEKNLFKTLPNACIDVNNTADLDIYIEVFNDMVVLPSNGANVKTAIGTIKSNTLSITVLK